MFVKCIILLRIVQVGILFTYFSDLKEQLKCVLSPYQKAASGADVDGGLRVDQNCVIIVQ